MGREVLLTTLFLIVVVNADITTLSITNGACVCTTTRVNARNRGSLSGAVVLTLNAGQCATATGRTTRASGYKWYQVNYNGQTLWMAGLYLDRSSSCASGSGSGSSGSGSSGSGSSGSGACGSVQRQLACNLLTNHDGGNLVLATVHFSGVRDNAFARNNLVDMCNGNRAARSSYNCSECRSAPAPGGRVCISESVLRYLTALASGGRVKVNELAGACHGCTSKHYRGLAIDLDDGPRDQEFLNTCRSMSGVAIDEGNHIHCQFNS